jgi:beta-phosphoglucomutase-like phosphatase (HAD superfamily)
MSIAVLDIDGTLVDTNYHHTIAWYRAFRAHGIVLPIWRIHRHIGMGGDQMVKALVDERTEREQGDEIRSTEGSEYRELIGEVEPMEGSRELIEELGRRGHAVVLASSAKEGEVDHYLDLLDAQSSPTAGRPRPMSRPPSPSPTSSRPPSSAPEARTGRWSATPRGT